MSSQRSNSQKFDVSAQTLPFKIGKNNMNKLRDWREALETSFSKSLKVKRLAIVMRNGKFPVFNPPVIPLFGRRWKSG